MRMAYFMAVLGWHAAFLCSPVAAQTTEKAWLWKDGRPAARLVLPLLTEPMDDVVETALNAYLADSFGWTLPLAQEAEEPGLYVLVGDDKSNPVLWDLVDAGVKLQREDLGDEGFRIFTHADATRRYLIITANTPIGLKHGCQEWMYFHLAPSASGTATEFPLDLKRKPAFGYRGIYMLPCWSAHDSLANWKKVLDFNSEITLNRVWFWLAGFPVLQQYGGEYAGTDLANIQNVQGLIDQCREVGMKFYIGGGWFTWHHGKIAGDSIDRGVVYYYDMVKALPGAEGIYIEPVGESRRPPKEEVWRPHVQAFERLTDLIWRDRPDFEFAIAIGKHNPPAYRQAMHAIDSKRLFWWWCWGDPIAQNALEDHPLVLRWHTNVRMSDYHGGQHPPKPEEVALTGFATSYDPGQGYGNPWNGWAAMGIDRPRNFNPYTMPYFSHQYWFRERCWDVNMTREQFTARMQRRLFDADAPAEAARLYLTLADLCPEPKKAAPEALAPIEAFVKAHAGKGTPRQRDTLRRMTEALEGMRRVATRPDK
ncbi:MAG: hypothetical protein AMXMBFR13_13980 [Phycisphaerae bacterium]